MFFLPYQALKYVIISYYSARGQSLFFTIRMPYRFFF